MKNKRLVTLKTWFGDIRWQVTVDDEKCEALFEPDVYYSRYIEAGTKDCDRLTGEANNAN